MPKNKRESFLYSVMMCFTMVLWMSLYNVSLQKGYFGLDIVQSAWLGFPIAYIFAFICDWFFVGNLAKSFAFQYLIPENSTKTRIVVTISICMVVPMVFIMSFYGAMEMCISTHLWNRLFLVWLTNIPKNFIMALPFQLLIAGPVVRKIFRDLFPEGTVLA